MRLRVAFGGVVVALLVSAPAMPAGADPARPTNDRSEVVAVEPAMPGVRVDVVGGDAFLRVRVEPGHAVEIPGYDGEPYLRIDADGTVKRNERSPARWVNTARYGATESPPPEAAIDAEPDWRAVGEGGDHVWHDHRTHSMGGPVQPRWQVPMTIDGQPVLVQGTLERATAPSPWPWIVLAVAAAAGVALAAARRPGPARVALLVVAGAALVVGGAEIAELPSDARSGVWVVALPVLGLIAAGIALASRPTWLAAPFTAGAGAALVAWGVRRYGVLDHAVLLTGLPAGLDRAVVALALGMGAAAAFTGLASALGVRLPPGFGGALANRLGGVSPPRPPP